MTNLERARNGERIGIQIRRKRKETIFVSVKPGERNHLLSPLSFQNVNKLHEWINEQINHAVTYAIDDSPNPNPNPELWRDLQAGEIRKEGDRIFHLMHGKMTLIKDGDSLCGTVVNEGNIVTQRRSEREVESLTLRDELALLALKAVNSDDNYISMEDAAKALGIDPSEYDYKAHWPMLAANQCYAFADAFLNSREVIQNNIPDDTEEPEL